MFSIYLFETICISSGYKYCNCRSRGSSGRVMLNGHDRKEVSMEHFLRVSCYIQQDDEVRPLLTVKEALMMAAHLKLGFSVTYKEKKQQVCVNT